MKRFFLFFLFIISSCLIFGQNLIPNPSAEDYIECPSSLGGTEVYLENWQEFRGSPDYWNSCSENPLLGWNNQLGYQEPRTGEGYIGSFQFHQNLVDAREYFGTELVEPLIIGETYTVSFYVSLAFSVNSAERAIDKMGFLLMETNTLDPAEQGVIPNDASYTVDEIIDDTTNWAQITSTFIADAPYQFIAFGNFYDDNNTSVEQTNPGGIGVLAYYYFDDFCFSAGDTCDFTNDLDDISNIEINMFPNPINHILNIQSSSGIQMFQVYDNQGQLLKNVKIDNQLKLKIELDLETGFYIAKIKTKKGYSTKRFMVQY